MIEGNGIGSGLPPDIRHDGSIDWVAIFYRRVRVDSDLNLMLLHRNTHGAFLNDPKTFRCLLRMWVRPGYKVKMCHR